MRTMTKAYHNTSVRARRHVFARMRVRRKGVNAVVCTLFDGGIRRLYSLALLANRATGDERRLKRPRGGSRKVGLATPFLQPCACVS